ncbi:hypothetical protein HWV62_33925 [Athelia sp. TMB]|nr:hypothetical protein HWV62_33925 [Athelia sp. TMB]
MVRVLAYPTSTYKSVQRKYNLDRIVDDFEAMLERARLAGVKSMIITGGSLRESRQALELAKKHSCHPTRSSEFDKFSGGPAAYLNELDKLIEQHMAGPGRVVAVGECGLDYDRTHFASKDVQKTHFSKDGLLVLAKKWHLPLFLHSRAAHADFVTILREEGFGENGGRSVGARGGVVHSFTGPSEDAMEYQAMGFHLSINGCSLKTLENLKAAAVVRPENLLLETGD